MTRSSESPLSQPWSGSSDLGSSRFLTAVAAVALMAAGCASGVSTLPAGTCNAGGDMEANPLTSMLAASMTCATGATEGLSPPSYLDARSASQAASVDVPSYTASSERLPTPPHMTRPMQRTVAPPTAAPVAAVPAPEPVAAQPVLASVTPAQAPVAPAATHAASITTSAPPAAVAPAPAPRSNWQRPTSAPASFAAVPQHLRDMSALTAREAELSDISLSLTLERQAILRVEKALRRHAGENSSESHEELTEVLADFAAVSTSARLTENSTVEEAQRASDAVRSRADAINRERKDVSRLMTAIMVHEAGPSASTEADILKAIAKYAAQ